MKRLINTYKWLIKGYKPSTVLSKLKEINCFDIKINEFETIFNSHIKYKKFILDNFPNAIILEKNGILFIIKEKILNISLIISLCTSLIFFYHLSSIIFKIDISGDYPVFEDKLSESLNECNLCLYKKFPSNVELLEIEKDLLEKHFNEIEFIEIRRIGSILYVKYNKRRKGIDLITPTSSLYATKDGIIKQIFVKTGVVEVKINQFVKKGDLLVNDTMIDTNNNSIFIGCEGKILAYTWYYYNIEYENDGKMSEDDLFIYLLGEIRSKVMLNIDNKDEYIEKENVLQFKVNTSKIILKVHYTLVEDITK